MRLTLQLHFPLIAIDSMHNRAFCDIMLRPKTCRCYDVLRSLTNVNLKITHNWIIKFVVLETSGDFTPAIDL